MKETTKIFETEDFVSQVIPLINDGLTVPLRVSGGSMNPYLAHGRDTVFISKPSFPLKKGDIAFFMRSGGKIVMHRVCKVNDGSYYFCGDAQTVIEGPVAEKDIFGAVKAVNRKGRTESSGTLTWDFFEKVWIRLIPLRPLFMKAYKHVKKMK